MANLSHYNNASMFQDSMKRGPQYVRVVNGPKSGSIGKVVAVRCKFYSSHDYQLAVKGRRSFWVKGADLEHIPNHDGSTKYVHDHTTPEHTDMLGRTIEVGHTLLFPRTTDGTIEMVMATVRYISKKGAVYARPFKGTSVEMPVLVRVGKPSIAMIIDKSTLDRVVMAKLSSS